MHSSPSTRPLKPVLAGASPATDAKLPRCNQTAHRLAKPEVRGANPRGSASFHGGHDVTAALRPVTASVPVQIRLVTPLTTGRGVWVIGEVSHLRDERVQVPPQPPAGWVPSSFLVRRRFPTGHRIGLSLDKRVVAGSSPASGSKRRGSSAVEHVHSQFASYPSVPFCGPKSVGYRPQHEPNPRSPTCPQFRPNQGLRLYRDEFVPDATAVVVAMISNGLTLADPNDRGMLDVVGFDTTTPAVIADFVRNS